MAEIRTRRRYLFLEYRRALAANEEIESVWDNKRRACLGTEIPALFPARSALVSAGYLALEEISGADAQELSRAGLSLSQAAAVLAAIG